ncbi:hypothetical protein ACFL3S_01335, partial [Gemmatimonadota bacterium]
LGAVLLTRGGRIRPYAAYYEFEEGAWAEESYPPEDETAPPGAPPDDLGDTTEGPVTEKEDEATDE